MFEPTVKRMRLIARSPSIRSTGEFDKLSQFVQSQPELLEKVTRAEQAGEFCSLGNPHGSYERGNR
jgi:hypothetical protein